MYPITASTLSLPDLAKHWQRSLAEQPPVLELQTQLLQAFWRGALAMSLPGVAEARSLDPRVRVLNLCRHVPQDAGLIVADRLEDLPTATTIANKDGSVEIDLRRRIVWPRETAQQTPGLLVAACLVLSRAAWDDYHELVEPVLCMLEVEQEAFGAFCAAEGFPLPLFWFRTDKRPSTAKARSDARQWLRDQVMAGPKQYDKVGYQQKAQSLFPRLSGRSFNKVWAVTVPESWQQAGAPRGTRKSPHRLR